MEKPVPGRTRGLARGPESGRSGSQSDSSHGGVIGLCWELPGLSLRAYQRILWLAAKVPWPPAGTCNSSLEVTGEFAVIPARPNLGDWANRGADVVFGMVGHWSLCFVLDKWN